MARPPKKTGDEKREEILRVRVTSVEKHMLKSLAKASGIRHVSDFVRLKALGVEPIMKPLFPDRELLIRIQADLGKIGSNLNQIARAINIRMKTGERLNFSPHLINNILDSIEETTIQLFEILKNGHFRKNKG